MKNTIAIALSCILLMLTSSANALLPEEQNTINLYQNNVPSVVGVTNIRKVRDFFYGSVDIPSGAGSGYVWDQQGHIVTNYHVAQGGSSFTINFYGDKKEYKAKLVGVYPEKDIAVLKLIEKPKVLKPISFGDSKSLKVGQIAIAIGNPFGLEHSISKGIISALGRRIKGIGGVKIYNMIQTDAAINQGNSGGPLLNSAGEVIGMNTLIYSTSGSSAGLGFAVPVNAIKRIVPQLIKNGEFVRPGLLIGVLSDEAREQHFGNKGVAITHVEKNGPAGKAGLQGMSRDRKGRLYFGDLILSIDAIEVNSFDDIFNALDKYKIGDSVTVTYKRDGKMKKAKVQLEALKR